VSEQTVVTIVVALLSLLGGAGFWGYMSSRKEAPIKKRDADVAVAHTSQQMALAIAEDLREDVGRIRTELTDTRTELGIEREARQALARRVDAQESTIQGLRSAVRAFRDAWANLTANWAVIRLQETPPAEPHITLDLREEAK
jgi:FtsZ-interacting cell division protein ZipA